MKSHEAEIDKEVKKKFNNYLQSQTTYSAFEHAINIARHEKQDEQIFQIIWNNFKKAEFPHALFFKVICERGFINLAKQIFADIKNLHHENTVEISESLDLESAFYVATKKDQFVIVKWLLDLSKQGFVIFKKKNALTKAAFKGDEKLVSLHLADDVYIEEAPCFRGDETALMSAVKMNHVNIVLLLLEKIPANIRNFLIAIDRYKYISDYLDQNNLSRDLLLQIKLVQDHVNAALKDACEYEREEIIGILLAKGARIPFSIPTSKIIPSDYIKFMRSTHFRNWVMQALQANNSENLEKIWFILEELVTLISFELSANSNHLKKQIQKLNEKGEQLQMYELMDCLLQVRFAKELHDKIFILEKACQPKPKTILEKLTSNLWQSYIFDSATRICLKEIHDEIIVIASERANVTINNVQYK